MLNGAVSCCSVGQNECLRQIDFRKIVRQTSSDIFPIGNPNIRILSPRLESKSQCQKKRCKGSCYERKRCMCRVCLLLKSGEDSKLGRVLNTVINGLV
jgi:hypothetical protein